MPIKVGGLYLLIRTDFHRLNEYIYKIGRSSNLYNRLNSYPRQSHLYLLVFCDDKNLCEHESNMIKLFQQNYKLEKDHGNEYFSGNLETMINEIIKYSETNMNKYSILKLVNGLNITSDKSLLLEYMTNINYINKPDKQANPVKPVKPVPITNCNIINTSTLSDKIFICSCGKAFKHNYLLERHKAGIRGCKNNKLNKKIFTCSNCNNVLSTKFNLQRHQLKCNNNILTNDSQEVQESHICDICNNTLTSKSDLQKHKILCTKNINSTRINDITSDIISNNTIINIDKINELYNLLGHVISNNNNNTNKSN